MHIPEQEHRLRRVRMPKRWWARFAVVGAVVAAVAAPAALANHLFSDVPTSSAHHNDISAIAGAGITAGCAPGLYCPADPVRRDQMGTFLRRGLGRTGASGTTANLVLTSSYQNLASDSITAGGATGGSGFVIVLAHFSVYANAGSLAENNRIEFQVVQNGTGFTSNESWTTLYSNTLTGAPSSTVAKMWVFAQPTGTTESYSLQARLGFGTGTVNAFSRLIQLIYIPFGAAGTSSLGSLLQSGETPTGNVDLP